MSDAPFEVTEEVLVEDLTDVKEQRVLLPRANAVLLVVDSASTQTNLLNFREPESEENPATTKQLNLQVRLVEGLLDEESGEVKYAGSPIRTDFFSPFNRLYYWRNKERIDKNALFPFKQFCIALGENLAELKVNDEWLAGLAGREVRANIVHVPVRAQNEDGNWVNVPNEFRHELKGWKPAYSG